MVATGLSILSEVRLVERIRLQVLLDELALASGGAFDPATAPRVGRLLRSGRIVGGGVDVRGDRVETDVALWDWPTQPAPEAETRGAVLDELFRLQQGIVFGLIDQLGVEITDEERERMEVIPRGISRRSSPSRGAPGGGRRAVRRRGGAVPQPRSSTPASSRPRTRRRRRWRSPP